MSLPDKCPLCCAHVLVEWDGKQRRSERSATFECQTSIYARQAPRQTQSRWCEVREREYLAARVVELEARCGRLKELGAELRVCAGYLGWTSSDDSDCITRAERACEAWDKEAKP